MASTVASGIFNAMHGIRRSRVLFKKLDESGYKDEMKRHNRAMGKCNIEREKWQERQVLKKTQKLPDFDRS